MERIREDMKDAERGNIFFELHKKNKGEGNACTIYQNLHKLIPKRPLFKKKIKNK